eukprot:CCRYP_016755-RC/>CCRYP_016755-RC protein AED:0.22 eAED:0.22 QI:0/0.36/0.16/1/0.36/0.16/12/38/1705
MSEMALECITLLTNGRYVSAPGHDGRDGGLSFLGYVVESITRASESPSELVQGCMAKALLSIMTCPKCGVHEAAMLQAVRSTFHVYLVAKTGPGKEVARRTLVDMLKCVFNRMEAYDVMAQGSEDVAIAAVPSGEDDGTEGTATTMTTNGSVSTKADRMPTSPTATGTTHNDATVASSIGMFASQYHTDSYLLFRALCKLSSKTLPGDENVPIDPLALNSKILSLELILAVFEHCGEAFRNGEKFIYAVQSYLCVSLLKNCMSNQTNVAHLSLKIFLLLVKKFKTHLKAEIEVFVANIFLRVLESPNSPFEQKVLVLEALRALCADPQMLTQLFLNYDCDFDAVNLYKDIVHHVTRISAKACASSTSATATKRDMDQEMDLSRTGLEVLVVILRSFLKALDLPGGSSSGFAEKIVDAFDKKRTAEQNFEIGMVKFTLSLKSGLLFFIDSGFVKLDARDMARFLYENKDKLDKTQTGEVLGKEPDAAFGFFLRVLYHYVDLMNFEGLMFDDAIRLFLSGFRLPGEAQKIDRIMEKFAERFTRQNADVFPSADTAFILAFSVIMLNTDLHNPSIKPERRMTLESFIRNNRGISVDGGDLPEEFLSGIFNRIKERPFSLKEDDEARQKDKKREKFRKEREEMMAASEQLFKKRPSKHNSKRRSHENSIDAVSPGDVVKPMFDVTWGPLIGTLSQVLESSSNETSIALCLSGFVYSIRISSHSGMSLARNTFVNSLAKFTTLGSIKEMKSKNIECIRTLLSIAIIDGEYLGESWSPILQCISQLGRLHLFASGLDTEDPFLQPGSPQLTKISDAAREMEENNGKAVLAAVNEILIDKVFSSTVTLSARGIVSFIDQLIAVSDAEIEGPRIFSLQRLVEVADYNMNIRPRLTWSQIWENMGSHFAKVGCHENSMVSMFAIDALRQLSFKFLEKPELSDFNFQRLFLKPFLVIMENPESREDTRELVLRCVDNIIRSLAHNLRSGWKIFFSILMRSSSDPSTKINTLGLAILQRLLDEHLNELCRLTDLESNDDIGSEELSSLERRQRNTNAEDFVGLCRASLSFVQTEESENPLPIGLSMRALCHTACYADLIADQRVLPPVSGYQCNEPMSSGFTYEGLSEQESLEMAIWRPLLDGLAAGVCSSASSISGGVGCLVQRGSLMALRAILLRHGKLFSVSQWSAILNFVILPAIQIGAENDSSPVLKILSDSPSVSSLDFLGEPLPLPPSCDDEGLKKFAAMAQSEESSPSRNLGNAELLVEASFADLRHGGDGDLSKAYSLKKKDAEKRVVDLQPFPDSWIATTAPVALGMMSDLISEHFLDLGEQGREKLWPLVMGQLLRWSIGASQDNVEVEKVTDDHGNEIFVDMEEWQPCEALVRIGCKEWGRCLQRVASAISRLSKEESRDWLSVVTSHVSDALTTNVTLQRRLIKNVVHAKLEAIGLKSGANNSRNTKIIDNTYLGLLPRLKIQCIASHCLQQHISTVADELSVIAPEPQPSRVLDALEESRILACNARENNDLAHAFQEACFEQWGVSVDQVDAALLRSNSGALHRGTCPIFFLTQEASAAKAEILLLSCLYRQLPHDTGSVSFAESLLMERIKDVLTTFLASEEKEGPSIDPNIWRNANESGCQVAFFCTSFVGVVINILETILSLDGDRFDRHKGTLFPLLCSLVRTQSDEIRHLVCEIFRCQVGPLINAADPGSRPTESC